MTGSIYNGAIIGLLTIAVFLLGTIAALVHFGLQRIKGWNLQVYEQAFREMMQEAARAITSYSHQTAVLEQSQRYQERPELLVAAPRRIQEIVVADWLAAANALSVRLEQVRKALQHEQRLEAQAGASVFPGIGASKLKQLEAEEARLSEMRDAILDKAEAYRQARPAKLARGGIALWPEAQQLTVSGTRAGKGCRHGGG
jgi:hypothetical protein